ncbi:hypothetical protein AGMMS49991_02460 [Spirochaetia bacterium]|nr:hypothetical protein AGMMS49991_02460 [Spirochaetia bacterium]
MKISGFALFGLGACLWLGQPLLGPRTLNAQSVAGRQMQEPFVSRVHAEARNNLIRLSWTDAPDAKGSVYIYRSRNDFDRNHPYSKIQPVEVPYGAQSYIDEVGDFGIWYYFIVASDAAGKRYDTLRPRDNTIHIAINELTNPVITGLWDLEGPVASDSGIDALMAESRNDGVSISYRLTRPVKSSILYRSINPITRPQDLLNAVLVQSGIESPFMDYPVPGIAYFYAVITEDELVSGGIQIFPAHNATTWAVAVPEGSRIGLKDSPELRSIPLPMISANAISPQGGSIAETPRLTPLSPRAERAVTGLKPGANFSKPPFKAPRAFSQDLGELSGGGEDYALRVIVQGPFLKQDWANARNDLVHYLSLPRSAAADGRARFYLGQSYYYCSAYQEALFEFIRVQNTYPAEAAGWIQVTLAALSK